MRRNAEIDMWHPSTDDSLGLDTYGVAQNGPTGHDTFSLEYNTRPWTKILYAWGNLY
ncbi:MAG: hypothetical protein QF704_12860 [Anaerolineales bacterium]|jgi:hypothetical protein|nr:hypothetical protein [Anaerolineales bacterium]